MRVNCEICGASITQENLQKEGKCRKHFVEAKKKLYLDNRSIRNLGIVKFAEECIPGATTHTTTFYHKIFYYLALKLYNPFYINKFERLLLFIAFRESGKSAAIAILLLYIACMNNEESLIIVSGKEVKIKISEVFVVIVSETGSMAEEFVIRIRDELSGNQMLKFLFPHQLKAAYDSLEKQWTKRAFRYNGLCMLGIGQGQQARGRIKGFNRISLLVGDDLYSEENTLTENTRTKVRRWWNRTIKNTVDQVRGKIWLTGTIVHEDTVIVDASRNDSWKQYKVALMPIDLFRLFIRKHLKIDHGQRICRMPYDEIQDELTRIAMQREYYDKVQASRYWGLAWPDRITLYSIAKMYKEFYSDGEISTLYQEYFHEITPDEEKKFKPEHFHRIKDWRLFQINGVNWFECKRLYDEPQPIYIQLGVDAGGRAGTADKTVITPSGMLKDHRIIIFPQIAGNFSRRDVTYIDTAGDRRMYRIINDYEKIKQIGWQDEVFRTSLTYHPDRINVGYSGNEDENVHELRTLFNMNYQPVVIMGRLQAANEGSKRERIERALLSHYETHMIYHCDCSQAEVLEDELENLIRTKHDDHADSAECSVYGIRTPIEVQYKDIILSYEVEDIHQNKVYRRPEFASIMEKKFGVKIDAGRFN